MYVVICILLDIHWSCKNMLFWVEIVRLSANQIVRYVRLKKLENYMRYQVNFLLPLKLRKISCYFGFWPQRTLGQSVCRIVYFSLIWLLNLSKGGPLLHCTCSVCNFHWRDVQKHKKKVFMSKELPCKERVKKYVFGF